MTNSAAYQAPVNQLLQPIDFKYSPEPWPDYPTLYGLTAADLPELTRLSLDLEPADCENYEWMTHALRAIVQIDRTTAIDLYLQQLHLFDDDDVIWDEVTPICKIVGETAIEPFAVFLKNTAENEWSRKAVIDGLEELAKFDPNCRDACVRVMLEQLRLYKLETNNVVNSSLVDSLTQLKAIEAADLIEEVFANFELDEWLTGSWPSVQVELGLKSASDFTPEELKPTPPPQLLAIRKSLDQLAGFGQSVEMAQLRFEQKQKPIDFGKGAVLPPKKAGFGGSGNRLPKAQSEPSKKDKKKKRS
jgi:Protein of unknown function (DUF1186)